MTYHSDDWLHVADRCHECGQLQPQHETLTTLIVGGKMGILKALFSGRKTYLAGVGMICTGIFGKGIDTGSRLELVSGGVAVITLRQGVAKGR